MQCWPYKSSENEGPTRILKKIVSALNVQIKNPSEIFKIFFHKVTFKVLISQAYWPLNVLEKVGWNFIRADLIRIRAVSQDFFFTWRSVSDFFLQVGFRSGISSNPNPQPLGFRYRQHISRAAGFCQQILRGPRLHLDHPDGAGQSYLLPGKLRCGPTGWPRSLVHLYKAIILWKFDKASCTFCIYALPSHKGPDQ